MSSIRKTIAALYSTQSKESLFSASSHTSPQALFQHGVFFGIINTVMENEALTIEATAALLNRIGVQYMATLGLDGKPKVRSVQYMPMRDGKPRFLPIRQKRCMPSCTSLRTSLVYSHARRRRNRFGADPLQCGNGVRRKSRDKKSCKRARLCRNCPVTIRLIRFSKCSI